MQLSLADNSASNEEACDQIKEELFSISPKNMIWPKM